MKKYLYIMILVTNSYCFAQNINMNEAYIFEKKIEDKLTITKYLKYSFNKDKKHYQYKSIVFVLIYKDSLFYRKFEKNNKNETVVEDKIFLDKETINFVNLYFDEFSDYRPKCSNNEFFSDGLVRPPPNFRDKYVGYTNNQWAVTGAVYNNETHNWNYRFSFKSKLCKFKCLGFFKNLKSRRIFRKLLKYMNKKVSN